MAVTATVVNTPGGPGQFPMAFSNLWFVTATVDPASVATQVTGTDTITVPVTWVATDAGSTVAVTNHKFEKAIGN